MNSSIQLKGVVARTRYNPADSDLPAVELEYVAREDQGEFALTEGTEKTEGTERTWTTNRDLAECFDWDAAQKLAQKIGFPAHAVTCSGEELWRRAEGVSTRKRVVEPEEVYRRMEVRGLA